MNKDNDKQVPCKYQEIDAQRPKEDKRSQSARRSETSKDESLGPGVVSMIHDSMKERQVVKVQDELLQAPPSLHEIVLETKIATVSTWLSFGII